MPGITSRWLAAAAIGVLTACSGSSPSTGAQVNFRVATVGSGPHLAAVLDPNGNDITLQKVELVLRDVRFKRTEDTECPDDHMTPTSTGGGDGDTHHAENGHDGHHDACESVNAGPFYFDVPLDQSVDKMFSITVDPGTFDQLRIKIHRPRKDGDQADQAFLVQHADLEGISLRVTGSYTPAGGTLKTFVYTSDLNAEEEIALVPPVTVVDQPASVDVTMKVDVDTWFRDSGGNFVDPSDPNNDILVRDNIRRSFHAFEDENHDGHNDHGTDDH
jgi:hypothetical protein